MTLEGKKKETVLKEFSRSARSELETAPYKPADVPSDIFHSQKRMGNFPKHRYFGEHLITCLLEVNCSCWGGEVGVQDHSLPSHRDIRCEWEAYPWCKSPGNNSRYNKWQYLLEALVYAISSSFGEKDLTKSAGYSSCLSCLICWTTRLTCIAFKVLPQRSCCLPVGLG